MQEKTEALYQGKFLQSVRYCNQDGTTYIVGRVSAEMKTKVTYKVDIRINKHGVVEESQCECAVGLGPEAHCKHVSLVLFALTKRSEGIITRDTCTEVLQTFHHQKKFTGSPVLMSDLKLRKKDNLHELKNFDPRPVEFRNRPGYPDLFRSVWLNSSADDLPIRQMYAPANIMAINNDHDYLQKTPEEYFLDELDVITISEQKRAQTEEATRGQSSNKVWIREREKRLHASSYRKICKAGPRTDLNKMAQSLTNTETFTSKYTEHGKKYEFVAVKDYSTETGNKVESCGIHVCAQHPFLGCSPDGLVGKDGIIEVKCPYSCKDLEISPANVPYLKYNDRGEMALKENHNYYYQVQGNLICTGRQWCDFIVWTFKDVSIMRIQRNNTFIEEATTKLQYFFNHHFRKAVLDKYFYRETYKYAFCSKPMEE